MARLPRWLVPLVATACTLNFEDRKNGDAPQSGFPDGSAHCTVPIPGPDLSPASICPEESAFAALAPRNDWRAQDYSDSLAVVKVLRSADIPGLQLQVRFNQADDLMASQRRKGETLLDLNYVPGLEGRVPIDLMGRTLSAVVNVPDDFVNGRNGLQLFVKDSKFHSQYGLWHNVESCGPQKVTLRPMPHSAAHHAYTDMGFDPSSVRIIGVKAALGDSSSTSFAGVLQLQSYEIDPPIGVSPDPSDSPAKVRASLPGEPVTVQGKAFYVNATPTFLIGGNWQIIDYGQNFGETSWFPQGNGVSRHPGFVRCELRRFRRAGIQFIRVGLLDDGRAALDGGGRPRPPETFDQDVEKLLELAAEAEIAVEFVIVDSLAAAPARDVDAVQVQGRSSIISSESGRAAFLADVLVPFLQKFGGHRALFGFDCIGEPEWLISKAEGGAWEDVAPGPSKIASPIALEMVKAFVAGCAAAVREHAPTKFVTVGVSATMVALSSAFTVSYTAAHYASWMGPLASLAPSFPADAPWMLEKYPTAAGAADIAANLDACASLGCAGALLWNLSSGIDDQTSSASKRQEVLSAVRSWQRSP